MKCSKLSIAKHRTDTTFFARAISPCVHHEESDITVAEVVVVLILVYRVIIGVSVVDFPGVRCVRVRWFRVVPIPCKVVRNLGGC